MQLCPTACHASLSTGTSLRGTCKKTFHSLKSHAASPLANCKVAFSGAALRCQTAVSACTKWCPSAQKHFRVWKTKAEFTTVPLSCHFIEVTVNFGEGWGDMYTAAQTIMLCCLWKLLDMSGSLTLFWLENCGIYMPWKPGDCWTHTFFPCPLDTHREASRWTKTCLTGWSAISGHRLSHSGQAYYPSLPSFSCPSLPAAQTWQPSLLFISGLSSLCFSLLLKWKIDRSLT